MRTPRAYKALSLLLSLALLLGLSPILAAQTPTLRLHYQNAENDYEDLGLWLWGDVATPSEQTGAWPGGRTVFPPENISESGAYVDVPLAEAARQIGLLVIDSAGNKHTPEDVLVALPSPDITDIWVNDQLEIRYEDPQAIPEGHIRLRWWQPEGAYEDMGVWLWGDVVTASEKAGAWPTGATPLTAQPGPLGAYVDVPLLPEAKTLGFLIVNRETGEQTSDYSFDLRGGARVIYLRQGDERPRQSPFESAQQPEAARPAWQDIDAEYATEAWLGARLLKNGAAVLRLWAPTADNVELLLYDKADQHKLVADALPMAKGERGVWQTTLTKAATGIEDLRGYFYHFRVTRGGESRLVLDPYAKSMAAWDSGAGEPVGKAALIDPEGIGPALDFADIPGFTDREDAIIYEAHVRDFSSDPSIADELTAPYGGFLAFGQRLDYLKDLGVTHIQLLPVLSYYHVNEMDRERQLDWASENQNYNWGYDPQSWFALSGMYASDPHDPENRVREFKELVRMSHDRGMGVILDVVYNHTAKVELLEDIEPHYYYFTDAQGRPKGSFGGGQVGSTHLMTRRLIQDSLRYLVETYKVDGFRFDMMGSLDAETIAQAYAQISAIDPKTLWIGEGWRTFNGDSGVVGVTPADQDWMDETDGVAVFSDEVRNELKSGFGIEGQPRFVTAGQRPVQRIYENVQARPNNVSEDDPGDIVQYIAAHDNLTLHDVIALSIKKDPSLHQEEILRRQRLANALLLTLQGIIFLHSGQEYGRTKQFRAPGFEGQVDNPPAKSTYMTDEARQPFQYPYFIHDSYDSSDAVNMFDWQKALHSPAHQQTLRYTQGLIALRRSTDAFSYATAEEIDRQLQLVISPSIQDSDLMIAYTTRSAQTGESYLVAINADGQERGLDLSDQGLHPDKIRLLVDAVHAGTTAILEPAGVDFLLDEAGLLKALLIEPLTAVVLKISAE